MFKMGDYGFKDAGECGGEDTSFHCLPDYHPSFCPKRKQGLLGDADETFSCELTGSPDAASRGWGYDPCDIDGDNYEICPRFLKPKMLNFY